VKSEQHEEDVVTGGLPLRVDEQPVELGCVEAARLLLLAGPRQLTRVKLLLR
jgi:hypothetical protein